MNNTLHKYYRERYDILRHDDEFILNLSFIFKTIYISIFILFRFVFNFVTKSRNAIFTSCLANVCRVAVFGIKSRVTES